MVFIASFTPNHGISITYMYMVSNETNGVYSLLHNEIVGSDIFSYMYMCVCGKSIAFKRLVEEITHYVMT